MGNRQIWTFDVRIKWPRDSVDIINIQIMNVYEWNGTNILNEEKDEMFHSTRRNRVEWYISSFTE